ncbi:MAG: ApaLI family restriction endonuclease [Armatimonadetes bacterium]|nr:ApaLI family restriction endonuclease [Armatimonadota bacterium]
MPIKDEIRTIANRYAANLKQKMEERVEAMRSDDISHYLIYRALGIALKEGEQIDIYQNKGRLLYNSAGKFLEEATKYCFKCKDKNSCHLAIPNTRGKRPKTFEIDCVYGNDAIEIKWRDATTDGDHITKEHTRLKTISDAGYHPIRVMFYYPNREQAIKIQKTLETLYNGVGGAYYYGDKAWKFVQRETGIDLLQILTELAEERINAS